MRLESIDGRRLESIEESEDKDAGQDGGRYNVPMKTVPFLKVIEDSKTSAELGGRGTVDGEKEELTNMATPPTWRLQSRRKRV